MPIMMPPADALLEALLFVDYASAKQQMSGSRHLNSVYVHRLLPQRRWLLCRLLANQRQLSTLYREQAAMAREVATIYSTMIEQRNRQSVLFERKKQLNNIVGELIAEAEAKFEMLNQLNGQSSSSYQPALVNAAEKKHREIREIVHRADAVFAERDTIDQQLDQLDQEILATEVDSHTSKMKFTAGEVVLEERKLCVNSLKEMLAAPYPLAEPKTTTPSAAPEKKEIGPVEPEVTASSFGVGKTETTLNQQRGLSAGSSEGQEAVEAIAGGSIAGRKRPYSESALTAAAAATTMTVESAGQSTTVELVEVEERRRGSEASGKRRRKGRE